MIWLMVQNDIHYPSCNWTVFTPEENCAYVQTFIQALNDTKRVGGIFTTADDWTSIMGNKTACTELASLPLWYGGQDASSDEPNYDKIGGWEVGAVKQFAIFEKICDIAANKDVIFY